MLGLRLAARRLAATPGFTLVAILTIALAIAVNTSIFALVDAVLFKPLPYSHPDRLLKVFSVRSESLEVPYVRPEALREWSKLRSTFDALEPYEFRAATLIGMGDPVIVPTSAVGGGLMPMLGVHPLLGRTLDKEDSSASSHHVAVIGETLWRTRFGADQSVLGKPIRLDGDFFEIVGVMPAAFRFPRASHQVWIPLASERPPGERPRGTQALARVAGDLTPEVAEARMEGVAKAVEEANPSSYGTRVKLRPFGASRAEIPVRRALYILWTAVGLVLLISCANLASLMLVRGRSRRREAAIHAALGATRSQLARPLVVEATLLTALGSIAGGTLSIWLTQLLVRLSPADVVRLSPTAVVADGRAFSIAVLLSGLTLILIGLVPARAATRVGAAEGLRTNNGSAGERHQQWFRKATVVAELAVSVTLLVAAGLLVRSFVQLAKVSPGFDADHVLAIDFTVQEWKYPTPPRQQIMFRDVLERLRRLPGVRHAELSGGIPPSGGASYEWRIDTDDGRVVTDAEVPIAFTDVGPEYFAALGLPLIEGHAFTPEDVTNRTRAIIISQRLARRLWPGGSASGHRIRFDQEDRWYTVVGVTADVFHHDYTQTSSGLAAFYPLSPRVPLMRTFVLRTDGDPALLVNTARRTIHDVDPDQPIAQIATARELYDDFLSEPEFYAYAMSAFAALAALLAFLGLFGVLWYVTALRTREFGVRLALGADPRALSWTVLRQGVALAIAGGVLGMALSLLTSPLLRMLLVNVGHADVLTYAMVFLSLIVLTAPAVWLPAHRAAATNPAVTLRAE